MPTRTSRTDEEFSDLVEARGRHLYRQAWLLTGSPHAAEDLVQTALAKAYAACSRVRRADDPVASAPTTPKWWAMPASEMRDELERLLPKDVLLTDAILTNVDRAPEEPLHELEGYLVATLDPADDGPGKVNVMLLRPDVSTEQRVDRDAQDRPVGEVVDYTWHGVRSYSLSLLTSDGGVLLFSQANTTDAKWPYGSTPTAEDVPLTPDELRQVAEDPTWTSWRR